MANMMTFGIYGRLAPANAAPTTAKPDIITFEEVAQENDVSAEGQVKADETTSK